MFVTTARLPCFFLVSWVPNYCLFWWRPTAVLCFDAILGGTSVLPMVAFLLFVIAKTAKTFEN